MEEQEQFIPLIFPEDKTMCNIYAVPNWQENASVRYRLPLHNLKTTFLCTVLLRLSNDQGCMHSSDFIICIKFILFLLCFFCHHAPVDQSTLRAVWHLTSDWFLNPEVSLEQVKGHRSLSCTLSIQNSSQMILKLSMGGYLELYLFQLNSNTTHSLSARER